MPNTYACKLVSNPNVPIFLPRVCTLVLFIISVIKNVERASTAHARASPETSTCEVRNQVRMTFD